MALLAELLRGVRDESYGLKDLSASEAAFADSDTQLFARVLLLGSVARRTCKRPLQLKPMRLPLAEFEEQ